MKNILSSIGLAAISLAALGAWSYLVWSTTLDPSLTAVISGAFAVVIVIIAFINLKFDGIQKSIDKGTEEHGKLWEANKELWEANKELWNANNKQGERLDALLLALVSPESARQNLQSKENPK